MPDADIRNRMSAEIRGLLDYWEELRQRRGGLLPRRNDMVALDIATRCPVVLPHIWMLDVERDPWRFRFRMISRSIRNSGAAASVVQVGRYISDMEGQRDWHPLYLAMVRVCETGAPDWRAGTPSIATHPGITQLERLSLPLAHDGRAVDVILSATLYRREDGRVVD